MEPEDIGRLVTVDEVRLSPDGRLVAFTVCTLDLDANASRRAVWLGPTDGSAPPTPCTAGTNRDGLPRFSPDGRRLAFTSHRGDEGATLHVLPLSGPGEAVRVVSWPEEIEALEWSPDGTTFVFAARRPDEARRGKDTRDQPPRRITTLRTRVDSIGWMLDRPRHLFVVAADGTDVTPRLLTDGAEPEVSGLSISPDGALVAYATARHPRSDVDGVRDLWTVPIEGGDATRRTTTDAVLGFPSFSADGTVLACTVDTGRGRAGNRLVGTVDLRDEARGASSLAPELDRNVQTSAFRPPVWMSDELILVSVEDHGDVHLSVIHTDGTGGGVTVVGGKRTVTAYDANGGMIACAVSAPTVQAAVIVVDSDGTERQLCELGRGLALSEPIPFQVPTADGFGTIDAWYVPPLGLADGEAHPALVNIHGGPFTQYGNWFFDEFQVQAGAGYGVLACNPRGSSGSGNAWMQAICWPGHAHHAGTGWGTVDADDILAVVDEACRRFPSIDPERLGVMGGSYGGYMTSWLAAKTHRFAAGVTERACNDLYTLEGGSSDIATVFDGYTGCSWLDDPEAYRSHSPMTYVKDIAMPLLIVHSEGDLRCTIDQADQLFVALRTLDRPVEYLRFPGESHELSRAGAPRHRVQRLDAILEWFDRHLRHSCTEETVGDG
jgi:dipeptidyl aminopeptidase/acylaminoacyl peptidase